MKFDIKALLLNRLGKNVSVSTSVKVSVVKHIFDLFLCDEVFPPLVSARQHVNICTNTSPVVILERNFIFWANKNRNKCSINFVQ